MKNKRHIFSEVTFSEFSENQTYEFIHTGKIYSDKYGEVKYTKEELEQMAQNFNENVLGTEVAVDINHDPDKKAYAWILPNSLYVAESKLQEGEYSLYGQLYRYTTEGKQLVSEGAYRYFSLEIRNRFSKAVDGMKKTFYNVISGIALTNSPVIKGLAPTFSENLLTNSKNMDSFKLFLAELQKKEVVSLAEKTLLSEMVKTLSEEEQEEVKAEVEAEQAKQEEVKEEIEADKEDKEADKEDNTDKALAETVKSLAETNRKKDAEIKKLSEDVALMKEERRNIQLSEKADAIILSDNVPTGFKPEAKEEVVSFMKTLSDAQVDAFIKLSESLVHVDFIEHGSSAQYAAKTDCAQEDAAQALACKMMEADKKLPKHLALSQAYSKLGMAK